MSSNAILNRTHQSKEIEEFLRPWLARAEKREHWNDYFEAMIYLWVCFNAWLLYVVEDIGEELTDSFLVQAAGHDKILNDKFEQLKQADPGFAQLVAEFSALWPVFQVKALVKNGIEGWQQYDLEETRADYINRCLARGLEQKYYSPKCYLEHDRKPPADWAHTLSVIYRVRCNLFHGGKSFLYSRDREFVRYAFLILWHVWGKDLLMELSSSRSGSLRRSFKN